MEERERCCLFCPGHHTMSRVVLIKAITLENFTFAIPLRLFGLPRVFWISQEASCVS
jgi:hypothetical protein